MAYRTLLKDLVERTQECGKKVCWDVGRFWGSHVPRFLVMHVKKCDVQPLNKVRFRWHTLNFERLEKNSSSLGRTGFGRYIFLYTTDFVQQLHSICRSAFNSQVVFNSKRSIAYLMTWYKYTAWPTAVFLNFWKQGEFAKYLWYFTLTSHTHGKATTWAEERIRKAEWEDFHELLIAVLTIQCNRQTRIDQNAKIWSHFRLNKHNYSFNDMW